MLELEESFFAIGVDIVGNGRSTERDGLAQHLPHCAMQFPQLVAGHGRRAPPRTDAGAKQRLVGIDVADAAQQLLIEQRALDGSLAATKQGNKTFLADIERFDASGIEAAGFGLGWKMN